MREYSKFISEKRRSVPTPKDLVEDGKCVFGTFDKEFETMCWSDFVKGINKEDKPELINYLKAKELYINEPTTETEEE